MKKILIVFVALVFISLSLSLSLSAQTVPAKKDWSKVTIDPAGDHLMVQFSYDGWAAAPDSIRSQFKGFSRGFNTYLMMNKPFKTDPRMSVAFGLGISTSSMFFKPVAIQVNALSQTLPFTNYDSSNHFKKVKLTTAYLEIPVELRYTFNPENEKKSWKLAIGAKIGTMLSAHTKTKNYVDKNNNELNNYIEKESKRSFFNSTKFAGTARVGYGNFSLFGSFQMTTLLKNGAGPSLFPYQVGICLSGL